MTIELPLAAIFVFLADQFTKALVARHLRKRHWLVVAGPLELRYSENSLRRRQSSAKNWASLLVLWALAAFSLVLVMQFGYFFRRPAAQLGLGAALGGAGSNVYDWLKRGAVIDFVKVGWWPVFNLADVAISLGAIVALWFML